jgi:Protein of unknown function (DUF1588)
MSNKTGNQGRWKLAKFCTPATGLLGVTLTAGAVALATSGVACGNEERCVSSREFYSSQVYGKAMADCNGCHSPGGVAVQQGAKLQVVRDSYPDFVSTNIKALRDYAKIEVDGRPLLLLKALGERKHGGGAVLKADSDQYRILETYVNDLRAGNEKTCSDNDALAVQYLDRRETLRKAAVTLAGRMPTDAELAELSSDAALENAVVKLTNEEPFYDRLREIWNDALLTERGIDAGVGAFYNNAPELYDDKAPGYTPENRGWTSTSFTQEPMRFIEFVVRNNLPFSDVVAGNYVVANPYTARAYGIQHDKPIAAENFLEWKRFDFAPVQNNAYDGLPKKTIAVPVAGVLTTPAFLTRWETTRTNKGRKRARIVLKNFLATDIFKFAQRPVDSSALTSVQNPTLNSPQCNVCHTVIDPIAGGFRGFDENQMLRFRPDDKWHDDMLPPGINGAATPPQSYSAAAMWLGAQIPADPRFGISIAQVMYRGLIGDEPLAFPADKAAADYEDRVRAYNAQNDFFVAQGKAFAAAKFDLRKLVGGIINSAYFRAKSGDAGKDGLHDGLGQGRLLSPEMLGRKYRATTGLYFFNNDLAVKNESRSKDGYLRSDLLEDRDWRLIYGGIDSGDVTKRSETMSPIMVATSQFTATQVACRATSYDFTKAIGERRLFRFAELNTVPFTPRANKDVQLIAVPENEAKIRENIKYLFWRLLGESVEANSEQVTKVYGLFADVWKDLEATDLEKGNNKGLSNGRCVAQVDYDKPVKFEVKDGRLQSVPTLLAERPDKAPYVAGMRIDRDDNFTIRAWQSVLTYMLMDYRFTHE